MDQPVISKIDIQFDDARLQGSGIITVENGRLSADGDSTVEHTDVVYLELVDGWLGVGDNLRELVPGSYVVCREGLYYRIETP